MEEVTDPWAEVASSWNEDPGVVAYADAAMASLVSAISLGRETRVLDFGCGTGLLTERLAPLVKQVVAVDRSSAMVEVLAAKALPQVRFGVANWTPDTIGDDELAEGPFDLIVCSSVCAFLDDYTGTVAMLAGLLAPGGHFVQWDWELDPDADEPFGLTVDDIKQAIQGAGLEVVSVAPRFDVDIEGQLVQPLMGVGRRRTAGSPTNV